MVTFGTGFTSTSTVSLLEQLFLVTVKKYLPLSVKEALGIVNEAFVLTMFPRAFRHLYCAPVPASLAVKLSGLPSQTGLLLSASATGFS